MHNEKKQKLRVAFFTLYYRKLIDMMIDFISTFINPGNKSFVSGFMIYSPEVVVEAVFQYCKTYSSLLLDDYTTN